MKAARILAKTVTAPFHILMYLGCWVVWIAVGMAVKVGLLK